VNAIHHDKIPAFLLDLDASVNIVLNTSLSGEVGSYGTLE
jgi:hypothetical protein